MRREIQESSSLFDQLSSSSTVLQTDRRHSQQSSPVKDASLHAADCSALCCSGLEQSAGPQGPSTTSAARHTLLKLLLMATTTLHRAGREKTAAGRAGPHVFTEFLWHGALSTPVHSFKMVDDFFSSFLCRVFFLKCGFLDIPLANLRHGYRCEC